MQSGEYARAGKNAGGDIRNRRPYFYGRMPGTFSRYAHQTGHALGHQVETTAIGVGASAAKTGDRAVDEFGIQGMDGMVAESHLVHGAAAEILDQHIGIFQKAREDVATGFRPEVQ